MQSDCSDDTIEFPKRESTDISDIEGTTGMQLATILNVLSFWTTSKENAVLDVEKKLHWSPDVMKKSIVTVCVVLERIKYFLS